MTTATGRSPRVAGPWTTAPVPASNRLPWHGHSIRPARTSLTGQPWGGQTAEKPWTAPPASRVRTSLRSDSTTPPPAGTSDSGARARAVSGAGAPYALATPGSAFAASVRRATAYPATPATATTALPRRTERRVRPSAMAHPPSRQRDAGAGEEPQRRCQPEQRQRRQDRAAHDRQRPPRQAAEPQGQHLRRVSPVEHA